MSVFRQQENLPIETCHNLLNITNINVGGRGYIDQGERILVTDKLEFAYCWVCDPVAVSTYKNIENNNGNSIIGLLCFSENLRLYPLNFNHIWNEHLCLYPLNFDHTWNENLCLYPLNFDQTWNENLFISPKFRSHLEWKLSESRHTKLFLKNVVSWYSRNFEIVDHITKI